MLERRKNRSNISHFFERNSVCKNEDLVVIAHMSHRLIEKKIVIKKVRVYLKHTKINEWLKLLLFFIIKNAISIKIEKITKITKITKK